MKKIALVIAISLSLLWLSGAQAQVASLPDAINKASHQRMLTQRILRNYIQLGMDVRPDLANRDLPKSVALFEATHTELSQFVSNQEITNTLADVHKLWKPVKAIVTAPPDRSRTEQLWLNVENLLIACNTLAQQLEEASDDPGNYLLNTAGLQRMLSQRAVVFHMMRAWGFDDPRYARGFSDTTGHFKFALDELIEHEQTSEKIRGKLNKVQTVFLRFEKGAQAGTSNFVLGMMANSAHKILNGMNEIVDMYEKLMVQKG